MTKNASLTTHRHQNFMIGRQPIFDREQNVVGYELLFRSVAESPSTIEGDLATTEVILNTFSEIGLENLVGQKLAFINCTRNFINGYMPIPIQSNQAVLEVLEDIPLDGPIVENLTTLMRKGFTLALDDVTTFERVKPMTGLAKIVKIDFPYVRKEDLPELVRKFHQNGFYVLAEKVETQAEYQLCYRLGCDFFQGYFFSKPSIIRGKRIDSAKMIILHALAALQDPNFDYQTLEDILQRDVTITYKLLKLANSAYYGQKNNVNSIKQTIGLIGITQLSGWLTLMMISSFDSKPHELSTTALLRAKLCENLGKISGYPEPKQLFMVGLFSILDALFDTPMEQILASVPVSPEITQALVHFEGKAGTIYKLVLQLENGQLDRVGALGLPVENIRRAYYQSIQWINKVMQSAESTLKAN